MTIELTGTMSGKADRHSPETLDASFRRGFFAAPFGAYEGPLEACPRGGISSAPLVLFAHGSSGIGEPVKAFARWISSLGFGFLAPDSFVLPDRITYTSPVSRANYERIHALRSAELHHAASRLAEVPGFNGRYAVAGTSEGGVAAARFQAPEGKPESARMIFSWSCEDNYHVDAARTAVPESVPVLSVMSLADRFFSPANPWLDCPGALGFPGRALAQHSDAEIVLIPGAPHTLFALPQAQCAVKGFLERVFGTRN